MKLHHIGIKVKNLNKSLEIYNRFGYFPISETLRDEIQNNLLILLKNEYSETLLEFIEPIGCASTVYNFPNGIHHLCFSVPNSIAFLSSYPKSKEGKFITEPFWAHIFQKYVIFACSRDLSIVEFILEDYCIQKDKK